MSQVNFSSRKPIQPLFPYVDRSVENILADVDRRLQGTGLSAQTLEPYIFEDQLKSDRLTIEQKTIISNKVDRLVSYYMSSSVHNLESCLMRAKQKQLVCFKSQETEVKNFEKDSEHKSKVIMSYRNDLDRIVSNKYHPVPVFCFNHFINYSQPIQIKDRIGIRALNVLLWNFDFQAALDCLSRSTPQHPDKMDVQLLTTIIRIFQNINIIVQRDTELNKRFCRRETADFIILRQGKNQDVSIPYNLLSGEITENELKILAKLSLGTKVYFLKKCMEYAIDLAKQMAEISKGQLDKKNNCYIPYLFLSNDLQTPNYNLILDHPPLKQVDKFFFAFKFLKNTKFQQYKIKLKKRLQVSSDLLQLGLCNSVESQSKIMQNYIDQTGDIKTIAILSLYQKMKTGFDKKSDLDVFIQKYKNILTEFNQQTKLQDFKNKQKQLREKSRLSGGINNRKQSSQSLQLYQQGDTFLSRMDLDSKKIRSSITRKDNMRYFCWICRMNTQQIENKSKVFVQDFYGECEKCHHGGHLKHLNLWFENNIRCPVPDCSCCCN